MLTPNEIFDTLKEQGLIKTNLEYDQLLKNETNIIIKINTPYAQFYHVDLHQNIMNLDDKYRNTEDQPDWIETAITKRFVRAYSTELKDATVYKNIEDFNELLIDDYENIVYDFLKNTPEQNQEEWGQTNPLDTINQIEIEVYSNSELKKLLQKYKNDKYKNLAHYFEQSYLKRKNELLKSQDDAIKKIKETSNFILSEPNLKTTHIDSNWHKNINELIEIIEQNIAYEIDDIDLMKITKTHEYPNDHILALY